MHAVQYDHVGVSCCACTLAVVFTVMVCPVLPVNLPAAQFLMKKMIMATCRSPLNSAHVAAAPTWSMI
jgi:hypothetical protein